MVVLMRLNLALVVELELVELVERELVDREVQQRQLSGGLDTECGCRRPSPLPAPSSLSSSSFSSPPLLELSQKFIRFGDATLP